jgi:O-acetyl-ADP-ribose deacetylase (regulator of RNase III)
MIKKVTGDILHSKCDAIAHGIAPNDDFKHGLALALRENWPGMYKDFRHFCQTNHPKTGSLWTWGGVGGARVINLFTQEGPEGHHGGTPGKATLSAVGHCLKALRKEAEAQGFSSLALPRLATGVGGLAWTDVEPLIAANFKDSKVNLVIYETYTPNVSANEGV